MKCLFKFHFELKRKLSKNQVLRIHINDHCADFTDIDDVIEVWDEEPLVFNPHILIHLVEKNNSGFLTTKENEKVLYFIEYDIERQLNHSQTSNFENHFLGDYIQHTALEYITSEFFIPQIPKELNESILCLIEINDIVDPVELSCYFEKYNIDAIKNNLNYQLKIFAIHDFVVYYRTIRI